MPLRDSNRRLLIGIAAFSAIVIATSRPTVDTDSLAYLSGAETLPKYWSGLQDYDGRPLVRYPPLYPAIIAAFHSISPFDILKSALIGNVVLHAATLFVSARLLAKCVNNRSLWRWGVVFLIASPVLYENVDAVLSETAFIFEIVLFLSIAEVVGRSFSFRRIVALGTVAAAAGLTRYAGVTLIAAGVCLLLLQFQTTHAVRIKSLLLYLTVSCTPSAIWFVRNYGLTQTLTGRREPPARTIPQNLVETVHTLCHWLAPNAALDRLPGSRWLLAIAIIAGLIGFVARRKSLAPLSPIVISSLWFVAVYMIVMMALSQLAYVEKMRDRFLSPVYIPLVLAVFGGFGSLLGDRPLRGWQHAIICLWICYPLSIFASDFRGLQNGTHGGLNAVARLESDFVQALRKMDRNTIEQAYTNHRSMVWWDVHALARDYDPPANGEETLARRVGTMFIWVRKNSAEDQELQQLKRRLDLAPIVEDEYGGIYRIGGNL